MVENDAVKTEPRAPGPDDKAAKSSGGHPKADLYVAVAIVVVAGIVLFATTREEAFFAPPKSAEEKAKAAKRTGPPGRVKNGGRRLDNPNLPRNVTQAFEAYNDALEEERAGHVAEAGKLFKKACELDPVRKLYWSGMANYYVHRNDFDMALKNFEEVYNRDVFDTFNLQSMGYDAQALRKDSLAARYYLMSLAIQPDIRESWVELFNIMHGMGLDEFYDSVKTMTVMPNSTENTSVAYKVNQYFLDRAPDDYQYLTNRAFMRLRDLRMAEAQEDVTKALKVNPTGAAALLAQAQIYKQLGQNDKAIAAYQHCLELSPQPVAYADLGDLEAQRGDLDKALHDYGKATEYGNDKPSWLDTYNKLRQQKMDRDAVKAGLSVPDKSGAK